MKTAEPIETQFGMRSRVGPGNTSYMSVDAPAEVDTLEGVCPIERH